MPEPPAEIPGQPPAALVAAVRRVLRPLVRLMLRHQVTYPALAHLLKDVYVDVVDDEFGLEGRPPTLSRVTLLTGIYRKEVKRLRAERDAATAPVAEPSLGALIVSRWAGSREFTDASGEPLALERSAASGDRPSFADLVRSVSQDIRPRSVLDDWLSQGVVELDPDGRIRLRADAFVPPRDLEEKSRFFARNVHDHLAAAAHNLSGATPPMLERSVYYAHLTRASVEQLEGRARRLAMRALQTLNREALALQQQDEDDPEAVHRMNFGFYFFHALLERARRRGQSS